MEDLRPAAVADRDHPTVRAPGQVRIRLDVEHDGAVVPGEHIEDMDALDTEQFISPRTPPKKTATARRRT